MSCNSVFNIAPSSLTKGAVIAQGANNTTLYEASMLQNGRNFQVAVKSFHIAGASATVEAEFLKEVQIAQLASATCQRVCRLLGCCKLDDKVCLVMSLYTSSAASLLSSSQGPVDLLKVLRMAVEIVEGLGELHAQNIWHLDLKPANILLDKYQHAYLADFGISHALQTLRNCTAQTGFIGTPNYMAPEQADADFGPRGSHTDVWGFATTILHLATGELPYNGLSQFQIMTAMIKNRPPAVSEGLPGWLQHLLKQCLSFDHAQRPSVAQLLQEVEQQLQQHQRLCSQIPAGQGTRLPGATASSEQAGSPPAEQAACGPMNQIPTLVGLLESDNSSEQSAAALALGNLARGSQQNKDAISTAGAIPTLLGLLSPEDSSVQAAAAKALGKLALSSQQIENAICTAGVIPVLVALLKSRDFSVQAAASWALSVFTAGSQQTKDAVFAADGLHLLVSLLKQDDAYVRWQAANALANLAVGSHLKEDNVLAADSVQALVSMLKVDDADVQWQAASALANLAAGSQRIKDAIFAAGALPELIRLLNSVRKNIQFKAASILADFAAGSQQNKDAIVAADALPTLVGLLKSDEYGGYDVCWQAASVLVNLAAGSNQNRDAVSAANALPALLGLLKSDNVRVGYSVFQTLRNLAASSQQNKDAICAAGVLPTLISLLKSTDDVDAQRETVKTLAELANGSQHNRNAIVEANILPALVSLSVAGDSDVQTLASEAIARISKGHQQID